MTAAAAAGLLFGEQTLLQVTEVHWGEETAFGDRSTVNWILHFTPCVIR